MGLTRLAEIAAIVAALIAVVGFLGYKGLGDEDSAAHPNGAGTAPSSVPHSPSKSLDVDEIEVSLAPSVGTRQIDDKTYGLDNGWAHIKYAWRSLAQGSEIDTDECRVKIDISGPDEEHYGPYITNHCSWNDTKNANPSDSFYNWNLIPIHVAGSYTITVTDLRSNTSATSVFMVQA